MITLLECIVEWINTNPYLIDDIELRYDFRNSRFNGYRDGKLSIILSIMYGDNNGQINMIYVYYADHNTLVGFMFMINDKIVIEAFDKQYTTSISVFDNSLFDKLRIELNELMR